MLSVDHLSTLVESDRREVKQGLDGSEWLAVDVEEVDLRWEWSMSRLLELHKVMKVITILC